MASVLDKVEIKPITSIFIMFGTVATVLFSGLVLAVFSTTYESSCTPDATGKSICTQTVKFKGWEAIPLQGLPGAIGTGIGIYAAFKSGKLPGQSAQAESWGGENGVKDSSRLSPWEAVPDPNLSKREEEAN